MHRPLFARKGRKEAGCELIAPALGSPARGEAAVPALGQAQEYRSLAATREERRHVLVLVASVAHGVVVRIQDEHWDGDAVRDPHRVAGSEEGGEASRYRPAAGTLAVAGPLRLRRREGRGRHLKGMHIIRGHQRSSGVIRGHQGEAAT